MERDLERPPNEAVEKNEVTSFRSNHWTEEVLISFCSVVHIPLLFGLFLIILSTDKKYNIKIFRSEIGSLINFIRILLFDLKFLLHTPLVSIHNVCCINEGKLFYFSNINSTIVFILENVFLFKNFGVYGNSNVYNSINIYINHWKNFYVMLCYLILLYVLHYYYCLLHLLLLCISIHVQRFDNVVKKDSQWQLWSCQ